MNKFSLFLIIFLLNFTLVWSQENVKVSYIEYNSGNSFFTSCRVVLKNLSQQKRNGYIKVSSNGSETNYEVDLQPEENKSIDIPIVCRGNCNFFVKFGNDRSNHYIYNSASGLQSEYGVLEVKDPKRGQPLYRAHSDNLEAFCKLSRIDTYDLPINYYCYLGFQLIILPISEDIKLTADQFQVLKNFVNFGGKVVILGNVNSLPKRWASLNESSYGKVYLLNFQDQIDLSSQITKQDVMNPQNYFLTYPLSFELKHSDKTIYLILVILFVLIVGPINFYVLQKKNKKILLFVTTPIFAILFSALLVFVFFIKEGFFKYYQGVSVGIVNQASNQILFNARSSVYFSNLTSDLVRNKNEFYFPTENNYRDNYVNTLHAKQILSGNYSKSRSINEFNQICLYDCNSKIVVTKNNNELFVRNGFSSAHKIYIYDRSVQSWFESNSNEVLPDQKSTMRPSSFDQSIIVNYGAFQSVDNLFQKIKKIRETGYIYILVSKTSDYLPFSDKEGFLQGENAHVIIGEITE